MPNNQTTNDTPTHAVNLQVRSDIRALIASGWNSWHKRTMKFAGKLNSVAAREFGEIRAHLARQGTPIGPYDLQIAAIALAHDLTLVTHNIREFSRVPGLVLEDWELEQVQPDKSGKDMVAGRFIQESPEAHLARPWMRFNALRSGFHRTIHAPGDAIPQAAS